MTPEQEDLFRKLSSADLLGILIEEEAGSEPIAGRVAVGCVVRTRVITDIDPENTYAAVILKHTVKDPNDYNSEIFQFSFFNFNQPTFPRALDLMQEILSGRAIDFSPSFKENRWLAFGIVQGAIRDNVKGANHYYNPHICSPSWAKDMQVMAEIGNHLFLKGK